MNIWACLQLGHTQNMGVVVTTAPLLKLLEITTAPKLTLKYRVQALFHVRYSAVIWTDNEQFSHA